MTDINLVVDTAGIQFAGQDFDKTILYTFHTNTAPIALEVNDRIQLRTAKDTGALTQDEIYFLVLDVADDNLVLFYTSGVNEVSEWGRIYGQYIEGPTLGASSPTIFQPSEMYLRSETEDLDLVIPWAVETAQMGADLLTAGKGLIP